jgi:uncharacterized NAD(P)/FAD-binding protein YdhS
MRARRAEAVDGRPLCNLAGGGVTIAIIGGGFSGAALALQLARQAAADSRILVFEPGAQLGLGLAYGTQDPSHRVNARAARMSIVAEQPAHFSDWIVATGACADDAQAALPDGRLFPRRAVFGRYVAATLAPWLENGRIVHVRAAVAALTWQDGAWSVRDSTGRVVRADLTVLATGHVPPVVPPVLAPLCGHPGFIEAPLQQGRLQAIDRAADVLIIGTGLSMADCVATLHQNGHTGRICAISRRGQLPRPHAQVEHAPFEDFGAPPVTALALLRRVRAALAAAAAAALPWQSVFDGLRRDAEMLWAALPAAERRRLLRHARPFWDTHRHRLPPPTADILRRRLGDGSLLIRQAVIGGAAPAGARMDVRLHLPRRQAATDSYDVVLLTAGAGRLCDATSGLLRALLEAGVVMLDETGQGLRGDAEGRAHCAPAPGRLFLLGPPARGSLADNTGVPEIARQAAAMARHILAFAPPTAGGPGAAAARFGWHA